MPMTMMWRKLPRSHHCTPGLFFLKIEPRIIVTQSQVLQWHLARFCLIPELEKMGCLLSCHVVEPKLGRQHHFRNSCVCFEIRPPTCHELQKLFPKAVSIVPLFNLPRNDQANYQEAANCGSQWIMAPAFVGIEIGASCLWWERF